MSTFKPCWWGKNPHIQTLLPTFVRKNKPVSYISERIETPDGDFLDLAWSKDYSASHLEPIVVLFHGLEGSVNSPYIKGMFQQFTRMGWIGVLMHFRGCSGQPNRLQRRYHSGETSDANFIIQNIKERFPKTPIFAIGYSLGGNMLLKYLGESEKNSNLDAAVAVSVPFLLSRCSDRLNRGFSRIYQRHLVTELIKGTRQKMQKIDYSGIISIKENQLESLRTFREFDDAVTAPIHGFKGAEDYYTTCSSKQFLNSIKTPTLILQAKDDPFISKDALPMANELSADITLELSDYGGHVGFISGGSLTQPEFWLEKRIPAYLSSMLKN